MSPLFHGAQVNAAVIFVGNLKPKRVSIEFARRGEIADPKAGMAEPNSVKRGVQVWCGQGHGYPPSFGIL